MKEERDFRKDWKIMNELLRDFYFSWLEVVGPKLEAGGVPLEEVVADFWKKVGEEGAELYKKHLPPERDLLSLARAIKRSSEIMGEEVEIEEGEGGAIILRHMECPWLERSRRRGYERLCRLGCDAWFEAALKGVSPELKVETREAMPEGGSCCERKIWREA